MGLFTIFIILCLISLALKGFNFLKKEIEVAEEKQKSEFEELLVQAKQGDKEVQYSVALSYLKGKGAIKKDEKKALYWFEKLAEQGSIEGQFNSAEIYNNSSVKEKDVKAAYWYEKAAAQGHVEAQYKLAKMYLEGGCTEQSNIEAVKWIEFAANNNHSQAQAELGLFYLEGKLIEKDLSLAFEWFVKSAQKDVAGAQLYLGIMYLNGLGRAVDENIATEWLMQAAKQKNMKAQYLIGSCYANGIGIEQNNYLAASWLTKASAQGYGKAQAELGFLYLTAGDAIQNNSKAFKFLLKAAKQGVVEAQRQVALMYYEGIGVEKDVYESNKWLDRFNENRDSYHNFEYHNKKVSISQLISAEDEKREKIQIDKNKSIKTSNYLYPNQANELLKHVVNKPNSLFVSIACRFDAKDKTFKTLGYSASFTNPMIKEKIDVSLKDITIISDDERQEYWFDDGINLTDLCDDEDCSAYFQFDKAKWQGKEGKAIESIIILDNFIYNLEKQGLPLVTFGFGINLVNTWILLTMQKNRVDPKSNHFKNFMVGIA